MNKIVAAIFTLATVPASIFSAQPTVIGDSYLLLSRQANRGVTRCRHRECLSRRIQ